MKPHRSKSIVDELIERCLAASPYELLRNMEMEMDRFMKGYGHYIWYPEWHFVSVHLSVETLETENEFVVIMEVPDVDKDKIDIGITEKYLEIEVREGSHIHYKKIELPKDVMETETSAKLEKGFLRIVVPKRKPPKRHKVAVR